MYIVVVVPPHQIPGVQIQSQTLEISSRCRDSVAGVQSLPVPGAGGLDLENRVEDPDARYIRTQALDTPPQATCRMSWVQKENGLLCETPVAAVPRPLLVATVSIFLSIGSVGTNHVLVGPAPVVEKSHRGEQLQSPGFRQYKMCPVLSYNRASSATEADTKLV